MRLCIIVPILNEAQRLPRLLDELAPLQRQGVEVILVDGGSDDGSAGMVEAAGFTLVRSARGRARQMNAGAALARGDTLLFLHADTRLPAQAIQSIEQALAAGTACWGRFDVTLSGRSCLLWVVARMMNWRSRCSGIATGDQAIFVTRAVFDAVGGFPDQPLMEDIELSRRLKRRSRPACLRNRVLTSGRRWHGKGPWRTILLMWRLRWAYWRGTPAEQLARRYR
ncbi:MAG: TIGR04283 family arsenosugar biosynthesis glycosyltransferase [Pseudomonadales bacterium]|jgi:rSAM/selenodomain-associated transferase 2|nr:TIGR04283 family arsenosugar biosynthesis glycosyltransferase [Pseudomonadales bacterium]MCC6530078.1 TIGR04283 family arsenosugar biosynthesis glycosyltransferase [Pseudomonadales bacterium]MCP5333276.1 TIGR04283 family arsenosugar biosynthesis glycosyltransferase [Pseudomonadales bacterium]HMY97162.1 TIGR04283 family arsenosugar biosynthesis glycosyltransferase [Pseudomonadales bacterium]HMZ91800.1 TIGR04283 family arsenosugar biosynthesis glycosyltransferase [Pseudomonadales bacterium]